MCRKQMAASRILHIGLAQGLFWIAAAVGAAEGAHGDSSVTKSTMRRTLHAGWTLWRDTLVRVLAKDEIPWEPFIGLSELLLRTPLFTFFHTGEAAGWHQLGFGRVPPYGVGKSLSGHPWQELTVGVVPLEFYPPEWVESVELLRGTEAAVLGWDALGAALNCVEPLWRTEAVYSRLWYLNATSGVGGSSGLVSFSPQAAWEFSGGYRRLSSDGRFRNGWSNGWNAWGRLQWAPSAQMLVSVSDLFTHWVAGLNGGIDVRATPMWWDELNARPVWEEFDGRCYRHDVTLTAMWQPDSTRLLSVQVWYAPVLWEYHIGEAIRQSLEAPAHVQWRSWSGGIRLRGELQGRTGLWAGGLAALGGEGPETALAPAGQQRAAVGYLFHRFSIGGIRAWLGGRVIAQGGRVYGSGGAGACGLLWGAQWWADLSRSVRVRQAGQSTLVEGLVQFWGELGWQGEQYQARIGIVGQRLDSAVIANSSQPSHTPYRQALLSYLTLGYRTRKEWMELSAIGTPLAEAPWRHVRLIIAFGGERRLGRGDVRGEVRWEVLRAPALRISPVRWELQALQDVPPFQHSGGELRLAAQLGAAYVRISFRNLLNTAWYRMPWYPQPGRGIVFAVTWSFTD